MKEALLKQKEICEYAKLTIEILGFWCYHNIRIQINLKKEKIDMKKDFIFAPIMLVVGILLFLLSATGMTAHIVISALGVAVLIAYAVLTRKEWKIPVLEIAMRAMYGISLIFGIVIKAGKYLPALAIVHKVTAGLFLAMLVVLFVHKLVLFLKEKKSGAVTEEKAEVECAEDAEEVAQVEEPATAVEETEIATEEN